MTPDLVAAVWLVFDLPKQIMPSAFGGCLAAPVWATIMNDAYETRPRPHAWTAPASVISVPIDMQTGGLAAKDCPPENIRIEYFLPGTEPLDYCPRRDGEGRGLGRGIFDRIRGIFGGDPE